MSFVCESCGWDSAKPFETADACRDPDHLTWIVEPRTVANSSLPLPEGPIGVVHTGPTFIPMQEHSHAGGICDVCFEIGSADVAGDWVGALIDFCELPEDVPISPEPVAHYIAEMATLLERALPYIGVSDDHFGPLYAGHVRKLLKK